MGTKTKFSRIEVAFAVAENSPKRSAFEINFERSSAGIALDFVNPHHHDEPPT
jgi:hypothetical protein